MLRRSWPLWIVALLACVLVVVGPGCAKGTSSTDDQSPTLPPDNGPVITQSDAATDDGAMSLNSDATAMSDGASEDSTTSEKDSAGPDTAPPPSPMPVLSAIAPNEAVVGSPGPTVVLTGTGFVAKSEVVVDGTALATTFINDTEVRATLPSAKLAAVGTLHISVSTSAPGGGSTVAFVFSVDNPAPTVASLAPSSVPMGSPNTTLTVSGASFVSGATVTFAGSNLVTTFVSATSLTAVVPASKLTTSGSYDVAVANPTPGGGTSTPIAFTVSNPTVSVSSVSPTGAFVGAVATPISLVGTGFIAGSSVSFNGTTVASAYVNATHLNATLPAASLLAAGSFPIVVTNPAPGGGVSTPVIFQVQYPVPTLASLSPASVLVGASPTQVTVTGSGFFATSQITFDSAPASTTYVDGANLRATLSAAQLANAGNISVRVVNPAPGGGTSGALAFVVADPLPTVASINPNTVPAGSSDTTITISGSGFVASSGARSNGTNLLTTYNSPTQLTALVPASNLTAATTLSITVQNPTPGGGTSNAAILTVTAVVQPPLCDSTGVNVLLGAPGTTWDVTLNFSSAPVYADISSSGTCPLTLATSGTQPYRAVIVQNTTANPVTLSAWAVCTSGNHDDDAFLTFYRRATVPATNADRQACTGVVSEGAFGVTGTTQYTSPEANGSEYCPGLTKANGGGISLASCERAIVYIAPYSNSSTLYPPPATMRLRPE